MRFILRKNVWLGLAGLGVSGAATATVAATLSDSQENAAAAAKLMGRQAAPADARWRAVLKTSEGAQLESGEPGVRISRKVCEQTSFNPEKYS